jgi:hypothetical protein
MPAGRCLEKVPILSPISVYGVCLLPAYQQSLYSAPSAWAYYPRSFPRLDGNAPSKPRAHEAQARFPFLQEPMTAYCFVVISLKFASQK